MLYKDLGINFDKSLYLKNHIYMSCTVAHNVINCICCCFIKNYRTAIIKVKKSEKCQYI